MIKLFAIGNIGNDAEVKDINGRKVINFSVAHNEKYKDQNGVATSKTIWVRCNYWPESTNVAAYLKKGTQVFVEGTPSVNAFETKDRVPGASLDLRVSRIELLGSPESSNNSTTPASGNASQSSGSNGSYSTGIPTMNSLEGDDLPF